MEFSRQARGKKHAALSEQLPQLMRPPKPLLPFVAAVLFNFATAQPARDASMPVNGSQAKRAPVVALVDRGAKTEWRYLDDGTQPAAAWTRAEFDDSGWKHGRSPLGFGESDLGTKIGFGGKAEAKHLAAYFRRTFDFADDPARLRQLIIEVRVDDGVVLYLNGRELVRQNLPAGPTTGRTRALRRVDGAEESVYQRHVVLPTALQRGRNVLAAAVHQFNAASSDLFFDLELTASEEVPVVRVAPAAREVAHAYREKHYIPAGTRIPDGYVDGGRGMKIAADGTVSSQREILQVDRARDATLRQHLDYVRWLVRGNVPPLERATLLAQYVDQQYSPADGRAFATDACDTLLAPYAGNGILIGETVRAGVCRHRALVFKLLADEAGLSVALARGNLGTATNSGAHAWNELILENGEKFIVDVMNPRPGFRFPPATDPSAARYLTVKNEPYYAARAATVGASKSK